MDAIELEYSVDHTAETFSDHLLSSGSHGTNDIYEEPAELPCVGDQYQVEIPSLTRESERLQLRSSPVDTDGMLVIDCCFGIGLDIPVMWVHHADDHITHEQEEFPTTHIIADEAGLVDSRNCKESRSDVRCSTVSEYPPKSSKHNGMLLQEPACMVEFSDGLSDQGKEFAGSTSQKCASIDQMDISLSWLKLRRAKVYSPLPCLPAISWSDAEKQSFLLGLYIFGKNLVQVRKFMECKEMGDILSYYYGKFYRSDAHRRWSECRKIRNRRCIHGQRIFTSWRQQELLSRVLPTVSKEVQDTLREVVKTFNEGRASLEEFIFAIKAAIGMQVLVEAIGIGKGKHDLTGIVLDPVRMNQPISLRSEIPVGKACSSLTSGDIIKFLTGDFRLSKARSNDLFWEAVWPRLLARGWHSEQPKDVSTVGSKNALVFLIPGINKFSRKKLVKGNHYFDSVSDVLNKVASDPRLIELEIEGANGWEVDTKLDQNGLSEHQLRRCYLQPRLPNCNSELMKFTVVDTSMFQGEAPFKVRELRSLPADDASSYVPSTTHSGETGSDSSEEHSESVQEEPHRVLSDDKIMENKTGIPSDLSNTTVAVSKRDLINGHVPDKKCLDLLKDKLSVKEIKCQFRRRVKSSEPNYLTPVSKWRKLPTCKSTGAGRHTCFSSSGHQLKEDETHCELQPGKASDTKSAELGPSLGKISAHSSAKSSLNWSSEHVVRGVDTVREAAQSQDKQIPRTLIDLNHSPPDYETGEPFREELTPEESSHPLETNQQLDGSQAMEASTVVPSDQQLTVGNRRQSTRNRPPTARALEALACGFLGMKRKERGTEGPTSSNLGNRPTRKARKAAEVPVPVPNTTNFVSISSNGMDSDAGQGEWHSKYHGQSGRKGTHELRGVP